MTTLLSTPTSLTIGAASTSALGTLAASMAAGTWVQYAGTNQDAILGSQKGASGSMINYCMHFPWNPITKRIEIVGQDHLYGLTQSYARYDDTLNMFVLASADTGVVAAGTTPAHGYGHTQVDPTTGDIYHHKSSGTTGSLDLWKCPFGSTTFTLLGSTPSAYAQFALGSCWWTGPFTGVQLGSRGAYMLYNCGAAFSQPTDGEIAIYDPTAGFKKTLTGVTPNAVTADACAMSYSPVHNCAVYGGGDMHPTLCYRLNADGSHTAMPPVPGAGMGTELGPLVCDPVTGNFLLLSNQQLWELNPTGSGLWTLQTGLRVPPPGVQNPTVMGEGVALVSIADYGVIAAISQIAGSGGTFFLYRHA
jgi:hypothetical protein